MNNKKPIKANIPDHLKQTGIPITHGYNNPAVGWIELTDFGNHETFPGYPEKYVITPMVQYDPKEKQWVLVEYQLKHISQMPPAEKWLENLEESENRDNPTIVEVA